MKWEAKISAVFLGLQSLMVISGISQNHDLLVRFESHRHTEFFRELATRMDQAEELLLPKENLPHVQWGGSFPVFSRLRATKILEASWKGKDRQQIDQTVRSVFEEALRFGFDPFFLLAVMQRESRFNPNAKGRHGEIGLMQIKPDTAKWISARYGFPWKGDASLFVPENNIRLGAAYFDFLRRNFRADGLKYLSAYNLGPRRTRQVLGRQQRSFYATEVVENYIKMHTPEVPGDRG